MVLDVGNGLSDQILIINKLPLMIESVELGDCDINNFLLFHNVWGI